MENTILKKFADKQLKQSSADQQYKILQAGTLVKSSMEMYVFMWPIVLGPWVCIVIFSAQDKPLIFAHCLGEAQSSVKN